MVTEKLNLAQVWIMEMEHEAAKTRSTIAAVPDSMLSFKPHDKSRTVNHLISHIVDAVTWTTFTMQTSEMDTASMADYKAAEFGSVKEYLDAFDKNWADAKAVLAGCKDEDFFQPWTMRAGEQVFFTLPKQMVLREWCVNHIIHHRAQLQTYIRLNNTPVPEIYGPTADSPKQF